MKQLLKIYFIEDSWTTTHNYNMYFMKTSKLASKNFIPIKTKETENVKAIKPCWHIPKEASIRTQSRNLGTSTDSSTQKITFFPNLFTA